MRSAIRFQWTKSMDDWGEISMAAMRKRLGVRHGPEATSKANLSCLVDMQIDRMIAGETLRYPGIEYRYIPSTVRRRPGSSEEPITA